MEWVETTGKTIDEAKELALDQLGVDSGDAEFEVVDEPKVGLFGRTRSAARVRARVSPKAPRAKTERRRRVKKTDGSKSESRGDAGSSDTATSDEPSSGASAPARERKERTPRVREQSPKTENGDRSSGRSERGNERARPAREPMDTDEQVQVLTTFLAGLGASFGMEVSTEATVEDDEIRVNVSGDGLGLLVGPRLATLDAVQEIARNALQRQAEGREYARIIVDVQGIRQRRRVALTEFVTDAVKQVEDEDVTVVFEVMSSADRKVVHDVIGSLDGVESASEGEDPRRRVVLRRA